jgi:hypothetical protein
MTSSSGATSRRSRTAGKSTAITHVASHARLLRDVSGAPAPSARSRRSRPDAIIVPTARPASALNGLIELAAGMEVPLVVLCSRQATVSQVAERLGRVHRARGLVVHLDDGYALPTTRWSTGEFAEVSGGRSSDLSTKRNVGLLLGRLRGWSKVIFVDDDITVSRTDIARISAQLDTHQIAGMVCRKHADNSVFCHARRLAKLPQDVFVTGAVLGVNCSDLPLQFFPDIYNEDWFFFAETAARHRLTKAGEARQAEYNPFDSQARAEHEEFGDLLAEGLYSLIEDRGPRYSFRQLTHQANRQFWSSYIDVRLQGLEDTRNRLHDFTGRDHCSDDVRAAIASLGAADGRYDKNQEDRITADRCVEFLEAWQQDMAVWARYFAHTNNVGNARDALDAVGLTEWQSVR